MIGKGRRQKKVQRDSFSLVAFSGLRRHFAAQPTMEPSYPSHIALRGLMVLTAGQAGLAVQLHRQSQSFRCCLYVQVDHSNHLRADLFHTLAIEPTNDAYLSLIHI